MAHSIAALQVFTEVRHILDSLHSIHHEFRGNSVFSILRGNTPVGAGADTAIHHASEVQQQIRSGLLLHLEPKSALGDHLLAHGPMRRRPKRTRGAAVRIDDLDLALLGSTSIDQNSDTTFVEVLHVCVCSVPVPHCPVHGAVADEVPPMRVRPVAEQQLGDVGVAELAGTLQGLDEEPIAFHKAHRQRPRGVRQHADELPQGAEFGDGLRADREQDVPRHHTSIGGLPEAAPNHKRVTRVGFGFATVVAESQSAGTCRGEQCHVILGARRYEARAAAELVRFLLLLDPNGEA
mmetsp:Transcript_172662/g.553359  ORF Transcript_172662/g.553359 Transcript_172662/m.553359 type:complete len:293 (+) Transcript_172662:685-1563(+)